MNAAQKELFLVPFPFSDGSGKKVRPVLVLSKDQFNNTSQDVIVCAITSNLEKHSYSLQISQKDLEEGTLHTSSTIKIENILKVDKTLLLKKIGKIKEPTFTQAQEKLYTLFQ